MVNASELRKESYKGQKKANLRLFQSAALALEDKDKTIKHLRAALADNIKSYRASLQELNPVRVVYKDGMDDNEIAADALRHVAEGWDEEGILMFTGHEIAADILFTADELVKGLDSIGNK
ncbi:hypothetical protein N9924_00635 [bacterium]|nr:hypothetical protein [bacterium]